MDTSIEDVIATHLPSRSVFLSYAATDRAFAERLGRRLTDLGSSVFDPAGLTPGDAWEDALMQAIGQSDLIVFVVPRREGEGKQALFEVGAARALGKAVIPVIVEPGRAANTEVATAVSRAGIIPAYRLDDAAVATAVLAA